MEPTGIEPVTSCLQKSSGVGPQETGPFGQQWAATGQIGTAHLSCRGDCGAQNSKTGYFAGLFSECPRQESNLDLPLRRTRANAAHKADFRSVTGALADPAHHGSGGIGCDSAGLGHQNRTGAQTNAPRGAVPPCASEGLILRPSTTQAEVTDLVRALLNNEQVADS
jgi:hypothetical protein